jgi:hypothetical protein
LSISFIKVWLRAHFFEEAVKFSAMIQLLIDLPAERPFSVYAIKEEVQSNDIDWSFHAPLVALGKVNLGLYEVMIGDGLKWRRERQDVWLAYDINNLAWSPITKAPFCDLDG